MDRNRKEELLAEIFLSATEWLDGSIVWDLAEYAEDDPETYGWASRIVISAEGETWQTYAQTLESPAESENYWSAVISVDGAPVVKATGNWEESSVWGEALWGPVLDRLGV